MIIYQMILGVLFIIVALLAIIESAKKGKFESGWCCAILWCLSALVLVVVVNQ